MKKNAFTVEFSPEWSINNSGGVPSVVPNVVNKIYFQVKSKENKAGIVFKSAELIEVKQVPMQKPVRTVIVKDIKHVHNGMSEFEFTPAYPGKDSKTFSMYFLSVSTAGDKQEFLVPKMDPK